MIGIACLLALLATGLTACDLNFLTPEAIPPSPAPTSTPEPEPAETPDTGVTTLVFWEPFALDRPQGLLLGEMVRDFEAENPDIVMEIVAKSGYVGIHGAMQAQLLEGELPDLAVAFPSMIAEYAAAGVVVPLDAYLGDPELGLTGDDLADIFPGYLEAGRFPGFGRQTLAFPFSQNAIGLWVNETLLQQAGWERAPATWAEFEQACFDVAATSGARCYPFVESVSTLNAWLYSRGGRQLDASGRRATFNDLAGIESLALLQRLIDAGLAWRPEEPFGDYVAFANGQAAFTFSSTGNSLLYVDAYDGALQKRRRAFPVAPDHDPTSRPGKPCHGSVRREYIHPSKRPCPARGRMALYPVVHRTTPVSPLGRGFAVHAGTPLCAGVDDRYPGSVSVLPGPGRGDLPYGRPEPAVAAELEIRDILYTAILSVTQGFLDPKTALDQAAREANSVLSGQQ